MKIDKQNGNIAFAESEHKYWDISDPSKHYTSVTTLIGTYENEFDKEFWSAYKALEKLIPKENWVIEKKSLLNSKKIRKELLEAYNISQNDLNREQQAILDDWQRKNMESCERGSKIHAEIENSFYNKKTDIDVSKFGVGGKFICKKNYYDLDLEYGVYPEYLIYRESPDGKLLIAGQIDLIIKRGNEIVIADHKGLPLDTPILTSAGWSTMENLKVGDKVFDKEGNLCNVIVKSEIHHNPCYKINFDNSESIIADCEHRWLISFKKRPDGYTHTVMTTKEIKEYLESRTKKHSQAIPKILNAKPINLDDKEFKIDPYLLGVWLGDGTSNSGYITQQKDSPVWDELKRRGYTIGHNVITTEGGENVETRKVDTLKESLKELGLIGNKHIPQDYMLGSYEQRLDLLRGLMDTDGSFNIKRRRFVMNTSHKWQVYDLRKLLGTLGIKSTIFDVVNTCNGKKFPGWNLCFTTNKFNPFLTRNQDIIPATGIDKNSFRNIDSIEIVETVPTQCIAVDSPSHTYLAGESCIVTHNTNQKINLKSGYDSNIKSTAKMKYPLNHLDDCNFNHYQLQLSTYAWMLQKINPDFIIKDLILNHYDHEGNNTLYHCEYLKDDVERMLYDYKKKSILKESRDKRKKIEY